MENQEGSKMVSNNGKENELREHNSEVEEQSPEQDISFRKKMKNPDFSRKVWRTLFVANGFWCLGFIISQWGPAFLDIQIITRSDLESASFFFTAGSVGYLVGSLAAGVAYDKLSKSMILLMVLLGLGVSTIVLPWCSIYAMMIIINFVLSFFGGALDTVGNAEMTRVWGKEGEMAMQFTHFMFAFGGVIGPLATEPFLTPDPGNVTVLNNKTDMSNATTNVTGSFTTPVLPLNTDVHYAFIISGSFPLILAILFAVQLHAARIQRKKQQDGAQTRKDIKQPLPPCLFLFVLSLFCSFYFVYCLVEDTFVAFLSTFVVKQLNWSKSNGALVSSLFWVSIAASRFIAIFAVRVLNSVKLLFIACICIAVFLFAFLMFSQYNVSWGVWLSTAGLGLAMAPVFPSGFTWMEEDFMRVTGKVASSILIGASAGTMVNPIILGYLMQELTPMWFSYLMFLQSLLCVCIFLFLLALSRLYIRKHYSTKTEVVEQDQETTAPIAVQNVDDTTTTGNSSML